MNEPYGPRTAFGQLIHATKYRAPEERFDDYCVRYARAVSDTDQEFRRVLRYVRGQELLPAGRQQHSMGRPYLTTAYNCLGRDTLVLTREYGMTEISSLAGTVVSVLDGNRQWQTAAFTSFGVQDLHSIVFTNSNKSLHILATIDHTWIANGSRITTATLRRNDRIDFLTRPLPSQTISLTAHDSLTGMTYKKGVIHGIIYGDGTRAANRFGFNIRICGQSLYNDLIPYFGEYPSSMPPSCNGDHIFYFYGDNAWTDFKSFPDISFSEQYLLGFVRGWLAADGCVSTQPEVTICGGPLEEAWIRQFGPIVGFNATGSSALNNETNFGKRLKLSRNIRFDRRFLDKDDFLLSHHRDRFVCREVPEWRVASISSEPVCRDEVFCAIVPTTHSFSLSGGLHTGNCFVGNSVPDSYSGIMDALKEGGMTLRTGGGVGWDFSTLRPSGEPIRGLGHGSFSSGPVSFMRVWNVNCETILTAGHRRGAMMGVMRVDHPDILKFVNAKRNTGELKNFNMSVAVTNEFMEALANDGLYKLRFGGADFTVARAVDVWSVIMENNWDWAEPGVLFIDRINERNPLYYCETISATNPCFAAETLIVTDHGAIPIEDLVGAGPTTIWNGEDWQTVDTFRETGRNQPMLKITLHDGASLRVTPYHRMIKEFGDCEAADLKIGDKLSLSNVIYHGNISEPAAYLKGFLLGDGCLGRGGRPQPLLYLYPPKYSCHDRLVVSANELRLGVVRTNAITDLGFVDQVTDEYERKVMTGLTPFSASLREWCSNYKSLLPRVVYQWTLHTKREFLAGLFDADGTTMDTANGFGYQLSSISRQMLIDVQTLLKSCGVRSKVARMHAARHKDMPGGTYFCQESWRLTIAQESSIIFAAQMSFSRLKSFADRHTTYTVKSKAGIVVAIEEDGIDDIVYCCTVAHRHEVALAIGITTGQCAEQPLPPYGACLLGSINLVKMLSPQRGERRGSLQVVDPTAKRYDIDWELLDDVVDCAVRAFDNVPERTIFPLEQQRQEAISKRRMGLGVTGMANALEVMGYRYGSAEYISAQDTILERIANQAYATSIQLAIEKGPFPLWDADRYCAGWFMNERLAPHIRKLASLHGLRNGLLLSIAPTGTISMAADNVSSGIEPPYSINTKMDIQMPDGPQSFDVVDYAKQFFGVTCQTANETTAEQHIQVLCGAQRWVDSSVSKTCNVNGQIAGTGPGVTFSDFKNLYLMAYEGGAKGCTTFNKSGKLMGVRHELPDADEGMACRIDGTTGLRTCDE